MDASEVNEVINNICDKLDMGVKNLSELVPAFQAMNVSKELIWGLFFLIISIISLMNFFRLNKKLNERDENGYTYPPSKRQDFKYDSYIFLFLFFILLVIVFGEISSVVQWIVAPEAMTIQYILDMVN